MIMGYSNSSLVAYTLLSPNHSGLRTEQIDRISPHCVVGQCTAESIGMAGSDCMWKRRIVPGVLPVMRMIRGQ